MQPRCFKTLVVMRGVIASMVVEMSETNCWVFCRCVAAVLCEPVRVGPVGQLGTGACLKREDAMLQVKVRIHQH